jgi:hypothetical protein
MVTINRSKDILMLLLYAKGHNGQECEPVQGKTRLMKMVFLFDKEIRSKFKLNKAIPNSAMPDFVAYDYGPFSVQVYEDLEFLIEMGFVEASTVGDTEILDEEVREYEYWQATTNYDDPSGMEFQEQFRLTDLGKQFVEEKLLIGISTNQRRALDEFKSRCTAADLRTLLRYVYSKYPNMATGSKIKDKVLGK